MDRHNLVVDCVNEFQIVFLPADHNDTPPNNHHSPSSSLESVSVKSVQQQRNQKSSLNEDDVNDVEANRYPDFGKFYSESSLSTRKSETSSLTGNCQQAQTHTLRLPPLLVPMDVQKCCSPNDVNADTCSDQTWDCRCGKSYLSFYSLQIHLSTCPLVPPDQLPPVLTPMTHFPRTGVSSRCGTRDKDTNSRKMMTEKQPKAIGTCSKKIRTQKSVKELMVDTIDQEIAEIKRKIIELDNADCDLDMLESDNSFWIQKDKLMSRLVVLWKKKCLLVGHRYTIGNDFTFDFIEETSVRLAAEKEVKKLLEKRIFPTEEVYKMLVYKLIESGLDFFSAEVKAREYFFKMSKEIKSCKKNEMDCALEILVKNDRMSVDMPVVVDKQLEQKLRQHEEISRINMQKVFAECFAVESPEFEIDLSDDGPEVLDLVSSDDDD